MYRVIDVSAAAPGVFADAVNAALPEQAAEEEPVDRSTLRGELLLVAYVSGRWRDWYLPRYGITVEGRQVFREDDGDTVHAVSAIDGVTRYILGHNRTATAARRPPPGPATGPGPVPRAGSAPAPCRPGRPG